MTISFHHVALAVKDCDKSSKWYQDKLGFKLTDSYDKKGTGIRILQLDDVRLELISFGDNTKDLPSYRSDLMEDLHVVGTKHLCLEIKGLDEFIEKLKGKGVQFAIEPDTTFFGGRYVFFKDEDGILIEAYES